MHSYYYKDTTKSFLHQSIEEIIGRIAIANQFGSMQTQQKSWERQIDILKQTLVGIDGTILIEFNIPRLGKRVDVLLIVEGVVFVIEFKVGEKNYHKHYIDQVWDYALDLKNFHQSSHDRVLIPILVSTDAEDTLVNFISTSHNDKLILPIRTNAESLKNVIRTASYYFSDQVAIDADEFERGSYFPTPTIIEAAVSLYNDHTVDNITRSDASARNLSVTSNAISNIIESARTNKRR